MFSTRILLAFALAVLLGGCDQPSPTSALHPEGVIQPDMSLGAVTALGAVVLDFEELAFEGDGFVSITPPYQAEGYTLDLEGGPEFATMGVYGTGNSRYAGSAGPFVNNILGVYVVMTRDDALPFTVTSIDLAPFWSSFGGEVTLVGSRADGSTVTESFVTHTEIEFQPYALDGFTNLVELRWQQVYPALHQFDNIAVVTGPTSIAECMNGGWAAFGFSNQGQCIRFVNTGQDSR